MCGHALYRRRFGNLEIGSLCYFVAVVIRHDETVVARLEGSLELQFKVHGFFFCCRDLQDLVLQGVAQFFRINADYEKVCIHIAAVAFDVDASLVGHGLALFVRCLVESACQVEAFGQVGFLDVYLHEGTYCVNPVAYEDSRLYSVPPFFHCGQCPCGGERGVIESGQAETSYGKIIH